MFIILKIVVTVFLFSITYTTTANEYSAHVHGNAELTIAIDKNSIDLNLAAPAESLLGFEHKATTPNELAKLSAMRKYLSQHTNVINFSGSECLIKEINIDTNDILDTNHQESDHSHKLSHAEVTMNYQYDCAKGNNISSATVQLFKYFKTLEKIDVMWLNASKQSFVELNERNIEIRF